MFVRFQAFVLDFGGLCLMLRHSFRWVVIEEAVKLVGVVVVVVILKY